MASLYKQPKSPFWWIKFRASDGTVHRESTKLKVGIGQDTRKARELCAERTLAETRSAPTSVKEQWTHWVPSFLRTRYADKPGSRLRYQIAWKSLSFFLEENEITCPRQLNRTHCTEFMEWRQDPGKKKGIYKACHNTALLELKVLRLLMKEAVLRELAPFNPCLELGIARQPHREKPEYTDADIEQIRAAIPNEPEPLREFYRNSLEISRYQGCRISETHLNPMQAVQIETASAGTIIGTITFLAKGGKAHIAPLHPKLLPLFQTLIADGRTETYVRPKSPSKMWWSLLTRMGMKKRLPGACFHSLRVTVATRLARTKGVSETKAMKFIGHASTTVHRSYQRLRPDDLSDCMTALD